MNEGFTPLGLSVVEKLLDNSNNKRILIDIKHMSRKSRLEYFNLLETKYKNEEIPIIVSHGAVIGNEKDKHLFLQEDINFYDDEIIKIAETNGLFGIQLDERRIVAAGDAELKKSHRLERRKVLFHSSVLIWRQIQHIAELLDSKGLFAWGIQSLGSDFDGMINPLNGYWTVENYPTLSDYLLIQAHNYRKDFPNNLTQSHNRIDPEEIVDRIMGINTYQFIQKNYH
jgi:microsomal dipeptidase-like Zn-dependent dipeptidase